MTTNILCQDIPLGYIGTENSHREKFQTEIYPSYSQEQNDQDPME